MQRFPGFLVVRLAMLLAVLLVADTAVFLTLYHHQLRDTVAPRLAESIAAELRALRSTLQSVPAVGQPVWLLEFNRSPNVNLRRLPPATPFDELRPPSTFLNILESRLHALVGDDVCVGYAFDRSEGTLLIDFTAGRDRYRLSLPGSGIQSSSVWPFAWLISSNILIVGVGAAFATRQVHRPLKEAAAALARSANQLAEIEMPPSAPTEFQVFADRFNQLARRLQDQERERNLLLAGASHDLKAPLTRIRLRAEVMKDDGLDTGRRILSDADSMRHIINQFVDYQSGSNPTFVTLIDLCLLTGETVTRYRDLGYDLRLQGADSATIRVDPTAVERILNNLIDNALAHGAAPVEISLITQSDAVTLSIRDHGSGIAPTDIGRLLQPFERLDAARSLQGHCGLGLAIVDRLIREMGGALSLSNHERGGLIAAIRLPLAQGTT